MFANAMCPRSYFPRSTVAMLYFGGLPSVTLAPLLRVINAFRSQTWTMWPYQWCSMWTSLATDWAAHRIQTLCYHALGHSRHCTRVHRRLSHSSVWTWRVRPLALSRSRTVRHSTYENAHWFRSFLICRSNGMEQTTAINTWHFVNSRILTPSENSSFNCAFS